jgi:ATPase subunit of ABC transporter with duplicated ATPase domains
VTLSGVAARTPDGRTLFDNLTLAFGRERTGIVGRNGVGKSTLLRLISGAVAPVEGVVARPGSTGLMLQDDAAPPDGQTVADLFGVAGPAAVLARILAGEGTDQDLEVADWTLEARMAEVCASVGLPELPLDRPAATLSGGERTRARMAALMLAAPDLLLLDEPTNHLDVEARARVREALARWPGGAVVVSHDRELLRDMDRILEIGPLGVSVHGGGYDVYVERRAVERAAAERDAASARRDAAQAAREVQAAAERQARRDSAGRRYAASGSLPPIVAGLRASAAEASGGKARRIALQRQDDAETARRDAEARLERTRALALALPSSDLPSGRLVLEASGLEWSTPDGRPVIAPLNLAITGPERLAVVGPNGSGKSTLLKLIAGRIASAAGQVRVHVTAAYLDQDLSLLQPGETLVEAFLRLNPDAGANAARAALARSLFRNVEADCLVGQLSGGERLRAGLACVIGGEGGTESLRPQLLILDEPTNHLDLDALEAVEAMLSGWDGALLIVSHDADFLDAVGVTRRLVLARSEG